MTDNRPILISGFLLKNNRKNPSKYRALTTDGSSDLSAWVHTTYFTLFLSTQYNDLIKNAPERWGLHYNGIEAVAYECIDIPKPRFVINITWAKNETIKFAASSEVIAKQWVNLLQDQVKKQWHLRISKSLQQNRSNVGELMYDSSEQSIGEPSVMPHPTEAISEGPPRRINTSIKRDSAASLTISVPSSPIREAGTLSPLSPLSKRSSSASMEVTLPKISVNYIEGIQDGPEEIGVPRSAYKHSRTPSGITIGQQFVGRPAIGRELLVNSRRESRYS
jgi:hypothetical protein